MTLTPAARQAEQLLEGDPVLIVYAVDGVIGRTGSHAHLTVAHAIRANAPTLPRGIRDALVKRLVAWLDGPGQDAAPHLRRPWITALAALGVTPHRAAS